MRTILVLLVAASLWSGVVSCGGGQEVASTPPAPEKAKPVQPAKTPVAKEPPVVVETPSEEAFSYRAEGARDPFQPFIKLETKEKARPKVFVPKTPLQRYATEELKLVGIVWAEQGRGKALIEDPEGKGYVVGKGTLVGDRGGSIVRIEPTQAVIEEHVVDLLGEENVRVITMGLRKPEDEVNP